MTRRKEYTPDRPMYVSIERTTEFFDRWGFSAYECEVTLNGKFVSGCVEADEGMGFVLVERPNQITLAGDAYVRTRLYGKVSISRVRPALSEGGDGVTRMIFK